MPVTEGGRAELVRSHQKDEDYQGRLRSMVTDAASSLLGARWFLRWQKELTLASDVLYFGLTTLYGYQTLGEEYCHLIQVEQGKRLTLPSTFRRTSMILLQVAVPYLIDKVLARCQLLLTQGMPEAFSYSTRQLLVELIEHTRPVIDWLQRMHQAIFYLRGVFYHLSKRATGIHYISALSTTSEQSYGKLYRLMGWLMTAQLLLRLATHAWTSSKQSPATAVTLQPTNPAAPVSSGEGHRCVLCLSPWQHVTTTPCGHLFCWKCIAEACSMKPECPLCREPVQPSQLLLLRHFTPS